MHKEIDVILGKKNVIWDLDNTLYRITPEFAEMLDEATAIAAVEDLGLDMDLPTAKEKVTQSYKLYRDGGEIFVRDYGVSPKDMFDTYHKRKPIHPIIPYENLRERLENIPAEQYIFSTSSRDVCEKILKHIGLYEIFEGRFYSVEDFGVFKKNENAEVYYHLCEKINVLPEDCIFVDDSYSNLEFAKETGMLTVRIYYQNNSSKDKPYIDMAFKGLDGFLDYLQSIAA